MKLLKMPHFVTGRICRLKPEELDDFYEDQRTQYRKNKLLHRALAAMMPGKFSEPVGVFGTVMLKLFRQGEIIDCRMGANLVVTTGLQAVIDRLQGATPAVHDYQAIGTGTTAAAVGDTTLQTEVARAQGTLSQNTPTTDRLVTTFGAGTGTGAITETGRLNAATNGNLFARQVFSAVNKAGGDSLQVTHDITVS